MDSTQRSDGFSWHVLPSVSLRFTANKTLGIRPELGYAQEQLGDEKARLFVAGVGPYWAPFEKPTFELRYAPRFVLGSAGGTAIGVRHGVALELLFGVIGVEGTHQALWVDGQAQHDARIMFTFDPVVAAFGLVAGGAIAIMGPPRGGRPLIAAGRPVVAESGRSSAWS